MTKLKLRWRIVQVKRYSKENKRKRNSLPKVSWLLWAIKKNSKGKRRFYRPFQVWKFHILQHFSHQNLKTDIVIKTFKKLCEDAFSWKVNAFYSLAVSIVFRKSINETFFANVHRRSLKNESSSNTYWQKNETLETTAKIDAKNGEKQPKKKTKQVFAIFLFFETIFCQ